MRLFIFCLILISLISCDLGDFTGSQASENYRREIKYLVTKIANKARSQKPQFIVVAQNAPELLTVDSNFYSGLDYDYKNSLNGIGQENLYYGYNGMNEATPQSKTDYLLKYLNLAKNNGLKVLVTDYCSDPIKIQDSFDKSFLQNFISFQADRTELNNIPFNPILPHGTNSSDITGISSAQNFLNLINPERYANKYNYLQALKGCAHDLLIVDAFFNGDSLTAADVLELKTKSVGGTRLVLAYLCIGEAENNRFYWQNDWQTNPPEWLKINNPQSAGHFQVEYWDSRWQMLIADSSASYINKIVKAGFDGVYLDKVDCYQKFL